MKIQIIRGRIVGLVVGFLILLCAPCAGLAQQVDAFAGIGPAMQGFVDQGQISGIVTLVADKDRVLHLGAVGVSDIATGRKMRTEDLFWIASMSKPITAVGVGILVDEGKVAWDDPVEKYVPEFKDVMLRVPGGAGGATTRPSRAITVRDLLTHTSGMGDMTRREPHLTLAQTAAELATLPLRFEPGSRWAYSTAGLDVCGRVIEVASGVGFAEFMQQRVFEPLGMTQTTFWLTQEQFGRYAKSYVLNPVTKKLEETTIPYMYGTEVTDRSRPPLGGAGLFSTAEDTARLYQMALNHGALNGKRILQPGTLAEMTRNQIGGLTARPGMPWGLGFCVIADPKKLAGNAVFTPGSYGHGGAFGTSSWVDPANGVIYVIMLQRDKMGNPDDSAMRRAFQEAAARAMR